MNKNDERALAAFDRYEESMVSRCIKGTVLVVVIDDLDVDLHIVVNGPLLNDSCEQNCVRCNSSDVLPRTEYETCICLHAEIRAITTNLENAHVYVNRIPCTACWLALLDDPRVREIIIVDAIEEEIAIYLREVLDHLISVGGKVRRIV